MSKKSKVYTEIVETIEDRSWLEPFALKLQEISHEAYIAAIKNARSKISRRYLDSEFHAGLGAIQEALTTWLDYIEQSAIKEDRDD